MLDPTNLHAPAVAASLTDSAGESTPVSIVGSFVQRKLPAEFERLFSNGVLVDPRNGTPMEMDGYSAYLALKAVALRTGQNLQAEKLRLLEAVLNRLTEVEPFGHGAMTGSSREVHMRFTAAAVRLIAEGIEDGLVHDSAALSQALCFHLLFTEQIAWGPWFLHDSLECPASEARHPTRLPPNEVWGSSRHNRLVLNTHLDTLSTLIAILPLLTEADRGRAEEVISGGLSVLVAVLDPAHDWRRLAVLDSWARTLIFLTFRYDMIGIRKLRSILITAWHPLRAKLRARWPTFVMANGYLERDVGLLGDGFEYHIVNVFDLLRLSQLLRKSRFGLGQVLIKRLDTLANLGIEYAITTRYWDYIVWSMNSSTRAILLCEAMLLALAHSGADLPNHWRQAYCAIRRRVPPSPAILGYDPFVVQPADRRLPIHDEEDVIVLTDGRQLRINVVDCTHAWTNDARLEWGCFPSAA